MAKVELFNMQNYQVPLHEYEEVNAGWLSVLLAFKATVDFGVNLRNHNETRTGIRGMWTIKLLHLL